MIFCYTRLIVVHPLSTCACLLSGLGPWNDFESGGGEFGTTSARSGHTGGCLRGMHVPPQKLENFGFCERVLRNLEYTFEEFIWAQNTVKCIHVCKHHVIIHFFFFSFFLFPIIPSQQGIMQITLSCILPI